MAGGAGVRFWPLSRNKKPKQFIDILGTGKTLLQQTFLRFRRIIPAENIFIVTSQEYESIVQDQLPELKPENILLEPCRRNTAPCIAYANYRILLQNPDANVVVAPSDHLILDENEFVAVIEKGLTFTSEHNALLTIGITPSRPETGYGYIQMKKGNLLGDEIREVKTFTEKPNLEMAKVFFDSGEFLWNSGIFVWKLSSIMESFSRHLPDVDLLFKTGRAAFGTSNEAAFIESTYKDCRSISIDYGIMEKANNVFVMAADFGWSDLGTWGSLYQQGEKDEMNNVLSGESIFSYGNSDCIIHSTSGKILVVKGLKDYIVVESDGDILVIPKSEEQEMRSVIDEIGLKSGFDRL